jgi:Zn-dependent peptidase ImmA (M78 family)/DNA-binding XRE family transcriptional regulator
MSNCAKTCGRSVEKRPPRKAPVTERISAQAASRIAPLVASERIKLARELRGWTQQELTAEAGGKFSAAALSQLERGRTRPSPTTLVAIAEATKCPIEFFVARPGDLERPGFFRSLQATSARERRQHLARARLLSDFVAALEEHIDFPELTLPRVQLESRDEAEVEKAAHALRKAWRLEPGPIRNVVREFERNGIIVVRMSDFQREIDAFSVRYASRPVVVLGSEKGVTARSRFDAAHEVAHLVLHSDSDAGKRAAEREAHEFAAAFLMPSSDIRKWLPRTADWSVLMQLKTQWRVSIAALLRRACTLEVMTKDRYVNAMKTMSARGWRKREPGDEKLGALESPVLLRRAVRQLAEIDLTLEDLAEEASLPLDDVRHLLRATQDPRPSVDL